MLHDINFAARYADHICAIKDGQIAQFGTPQEIMTAEILSPIFNTNIEVIQGPSGLLACYH